jgi:hypothetical protein
MGSDTTHPKVNLSTVAQALAKEFHQSLPDSLAWKTLLPIILPSVRTSALALSAAYSVAMGRYSGARQTLRSPRSRIHRLATLVQLRLVKLADSRLILAAVPYHLDLARRGVEAWPDLRVVILTKRNQRDDSRSFQRTFR